VVSLGDRTIDAVGEPEIVRVDYEASHAKSLAGELGSVAEDR